MQDKVQESSNPECFTPSPEPLGTELIIYCPLARVESADSMHIMWLEWLVLLNCTFGRLAFSSQTGVKS
jgi:hypothetical protein